MNKNLATREDFEKEFKKLSKLMWIFYIILFLLITGLYFQP